MENWYFCSKYLVWWVDQCFIPLKTCIWKEELWVSRKLHNLNAAFMGKERETWARHGYASWVLLTAVWLHPGCRLEYVPCRAQNSKHPYADWLSGVSSRISSISHCSTFRMKCLWAFQTCKGISSENNQGKPLNSQCKGLWSSFLPHSLLRMS
jgi:hypothetical protein